MISTDESFTSLTKLNDYINRNNQLLLSSPTIMLELDKYYLLVENGNYSIIKIVKITEFYFSWKIISTKNSNSFKLCSDLVQKNIHPNVLNDLQTREEMKFYFIDISGINRIPTPERSIHSIQPATPAIRIFPHIPNAPNRPTRWNNEQSHILDLPRADLFASSSPVVRLPNITARPSAIEEIKEDANYIDNVTCKIGQKAGSVWDLQDRIVDSYKKYVGPNDNFKCARIAYLL
jgi:hypothetical protein